MKKEFKINADFFTALFDKADYLIFLLVAAVCFFTFQNSDMVHTVASSYGYLNGHIFDFYDYNGLFGIYDSYLPSTYILFALWNLPLYIFGYRRLPQTDAVIYPILMWNKLFVCIIYMACGYLMYLIAEEMGMGKKKSKLCALTFLTMPIGFYSQFIFGQYDVFTVFFVLLGFYFWLKDNDKLFILFFAVSFTFKYFAFLIFVPLLLIKQKNVIKAVLGLASSLLPVAAEVLLYFNNDVFREYVFGFSATNYVYDAGIVTGPASISIVVLICGIITALSYFKNVSSKEEQIKWALYFIGFMMFALFGLCRWHPQWLLLMVPFLTLGTFIHRDTRIFIILEMLLSVFFILLTVNVYKGIADETLVGLGIFGQFKRFGHLVNGVSAKTTMSDLLLFKDINMCQSFFTALLLIMAVFKHPKECLNDFSVLPESGSIGWLRTRFAVGVGVFVLPAFICLYMAAKPPYTTLYTPQAYEDIGGMVAKREVSEVFISRKGVLCGIEFMVGTYERENDVTLNVTVRNATTGETVFSQDVPMKDVSDISWVRVDTGNIFLGVNETYRVDIRSVDAGGDNCITLYRTVNLGNQRHGYAIISGNRQNYHLCVRILEDDPR